MPSWLELMLGAHCLRFGLNWRLITDFQTGAVRIIATAIGSGLVIEAIAQAVK